MGRVRKIFELVNSKLPSYNSGFVKMRGIAHPLDIFLTGRLRFARKVGSPLPIWLPDNQTTLALPASAHTRKMTFSDVVGWLVPGSKLRIDGRSIVYVDDIVDEGRSVLLTEDLLTGYPADTVIDLYGHPLELNGTFSPRSVRPVSDDYVRNLDPRGSAVVVSTSDQALVGEPVIDGVPTSSGDRVLLVGQSNPEENGIWVVSVFTWSRPADFSGGTSAARAQVFVTGGDVNSGTSWVCTSSDDSSTIADPSSVPAVPGNRLTWTQLSVVTTFVVHSDHPIYKGDVVNYRFFEYDVVSAIPTGLLPDGRRTYQVTIDVGIPDTLENGRTDQLYLRAFPAYESERRPLPKIPITESNIGPFLYDRLSGSFFEDLDVEEKDIVTLYTASGSVISSFDDGKNTLIYNLAIPSDSFLFWDLSAGKLNYSRTYSRFVALTNEDGKFHLHFTCVPEISHNPPGFEGWRVQVTPHNDCYMVVHLEPNPVRAPFTSRAPGALAPPPPPRGGVFLPAGVTTSVNIDFPPGSEAIKRIHILFDSEVTPGVPQANTRIDMESWEIRGTETVAFISHATIAKVTGRNVWASGPAFAKPNWLRLTYLRVQTDLYSRFNAGLLAT